MSFKVRGVLRIGFYEIIKLGMPPYAVVDEETDSLPLPKVAGDDRAQARALAIIHSHPVPLPVRVNTAKGYTRNDLVNRLKSLKVICLAFLF
ncbi:hypothetical protein BHE74_00004301 [Ensete ventricosum]|nr:hypothetical protein GW17_00004492 [Ensete ventricosum]RWW86904.1 hypothetical protein BHE74_00004301 [Ensete ventricosum]RZR81369.1 hypothetical protein BHM03_00007581 [Ensete ventricosum]